MLCTRKPAIFFSLVKCPLDTQFQTIIFRRECTNQVQYSRDYRETYQTNEIWISFLNLTPEIVDRWITCTSSQKHNTSWIQENDNASMEHWNFKISKKLELKAVQTLYPILNRSKKKNTTIAHRVTYSSIGAQSCKTLYPILNRSRKITTIAHHVTYASICQSYIEVA